MIEKVKYYLPLIIGLIIVIVPFVVLSLFLNSGPKHLGDPSLILLNLVNYWTGTIAILILVLFWDRRPLSSIGIRKMNGRDVIWGFVTFFFGIGIILITNPLLKAVNIGTMGNGIVKLVHCSIWVRVVIVVTAAITEEIIFRGYTIERLNVLTGNLVLSAVVSYILFLILHIPFWGLGGAIQIGELGILVTMLYVWRRSLLSCILMHFLNDFFLFIFLPIVLSNETSFF